MAERNKAQDGVRPKDKDGASQGTDPVKMGGIAKSDADAEDVTRDTYGFEEAEPDAPTAEERFARAERAAEEQGSPGIVTPERPAPGEEE